MREGENLYFTSSELEYMLELSGGPEYSILRTPPMGAAAQGGAGAQAGTSAQMGAAAQRGTLAQGGTNIREEDMARTLAGLYQRGFLRRDRKRLVVSERGSFFREIRRAPLAVILTARYPRSGAAVCYGGNGPVWIEEQIVTSLTEEVRLWQGTVQEVEKWLISSGMVPQPRLSREDAREWNRILEDPTISETVLRLERHQNGGGQTGELEVLMGCGTHMIRIRADGQERMELYTKEALRDMLSVCFDADSGAMSHSAAGAEDAVL